MAQVDTSMYQNMQGIDLSKAGEGFANGMRMADLARQSQMQKQDFQDQQGIRKAFADNTATDMQTGQTSLNRPALANALSSLGPRGYEMARNMQIQDMQAHNAMIDQKSKEAGAVGQLLNGVKDQQGYSAAIANARKLGIDVSGVDSTYDPDKVEQLRQKALSTKDAYDQHLKQQELQIKQQELQRTLGNQQQEAQKTAMGYLEDARKDPAYSQARLDKYNVGKMNSLISGLPNKDPDQANMAMTHLLMGEAGKVATGGVPTETELKNLTPDNWKQIQALAKEKLSNNYTPAEAGQFIKAVQKYANEVGKDADNVIQQKAGRVLDSIKPHLSQNDYATMRSKYIDQPTDAEILAQRQRDADEKAGQQQAPQPQQKPGGNWADSLGLPQWLGGSSKAEAAAQPQPQEVYHSAAKKLGIEDPANMNPDQRVNVAKQAQAALAKRQAARQKQGQ